MTGITQWEMPDDPEEMVWLGKDGAEVDDDDDASSSSSSSEEEDEDPRLHPEYEEHLDKKGTTYWYHVPTGESSWTRPKYPSEEELAEMAQTAADADPDDVWEAVRDEATGQLFFYNVATGLSQWTPPPPPAVVTYPDPEPEERPSTRATTAGSAVVEDALLAEGSVGTVLSALTPGGVEEPR